MFSSLSFFALFPITFQVTDRNGRTLKYTVEIKETVDSEVDLMSLNR